MKEINSNWVTRALASCRNQNSVSEQKDDLSLLNSDSDAEFLLAIGKVVNHRLRLGQEIETLASILNCEIEHLVLAKVFADCSPKIIFKSLMEDWSDEEIRTAIVCQCGMWSAE